MKDKLLIVGGVNSDEVRSGEGWSAYKAGKIIQLNLKNNEIIEKYYDETVPDFLGRDCKISTVFKAAEVKDNIALVCTTTEVFKIDLADGSLLNSTSANKFNDVHHLKEINGELFVVSTGLDSLIKMGWDGTVKDYWALDQRAESMMSDEIDYRQIQSTKPHSFHPNYVFAIGESIYLNCFKQGEAVCVNNHDAPTLKTSKGNTHDGVLHNGKVWFTSTNGWLCSVSPSTGEEIDLIDLNSFYTGGMPLGWCRGVEFLSDDVAAIGFSRLRHTRFKENVKWAVSKLSSKKSAPMPTRVILVDLKNGSLLNEFILEKGWGLNAVFSLHAF